jgi:hypothetical protein
LSNTGANATTHTAGVCTAISKKITSKYKVQVLDLPLSLAGHCLVVHISLPGSDFSIKFINLRLITPSQNKVAAQELMIKDLHTALVPHPTKFTILGGASILSNAPPIPLVISKSRIVRAGKTSKNISRSPSV